MGRAIVWTLLGSVFLLAAPALAATAPGSVCEGIEEASQRTVIVFSPPSGFEICREGEAQEDVVAGRQLYLELSPAAPASPVAYRLHEASTPGHPAGLRRWERAAGALAAALHGLAHSGQPLSELPALGPGHAPTDRLQLARASYQAVATPPFHAAVRRVAQRLDGLSRLAGLLTTWCGQLGKGAPASDPGAFLQGCAAGRPAAAEALVARLRTELASYEERRAQARSLLLASTLDPSKAAGAIDGLGAALGAATTLVAEAPSAALLASQLGHDAAALDWVVASMGSLRPGVPVRIARFQMGGEAKLEIDALPATLPPPAGDETAAPEPEAQPVVYHFTVVDPSYFDLSAGVGYTGGLPSLPGIKAGNVLVQRSVDQFVGLVAAELEPAKFLWPDRAAAGILRFPVIAVPVTRDPTQNFFVGAGVGAEGIGSIDFGPYLLREATLNSRYSFGQQLRSGTSLQGITHPTLQAGYFVSANVDLIGLFHLIVRERPVLLDAATGRAEE